MDTFKLSQGSGRSSRLAYSASNPLPLDEREVPGASDALFGPRFSHGEKVSHLKDRITAELWSGSWPPGYRLVESDLTGKFGVSRSLLRETLRELAAEGLLELIPNRGAVVRQLSTEEKLETLDVYAHLCLLALPLTVKACEGAGGRADFRAKSGPIWSLVPRKSFEEYALAILGAHRAVFECPKNNALALVARRLQFPLILVSARSNITLGWLDQAMDDLKDMSLALLSGSEERAQEFMRRHLDNVADMVTKVPSR